MRIIKRHSVFQEFTNSAESVTFIALASRLSSPEECHVRHEENRAGAVDQRQEKDLPSKIFWLKNAVQCRFYDFCIYIST
jgi:hypothetical protein